MYSTVFQKTAIMLIALARTREFTQKYGNKFYSKRGLVFPGWHTEEKAGKRCQYHIVRSIN